VIITVWKPGQTIVVDEIIVPFEGRAKETTTIPNKPTPIDFRVWGWSREGFALLELAGSWIKKRPCRSTCTELRKQWQ